MLALLPLLRRTYITIGALPTNSLLSIGMPGLEALSRTSLSDFLPPTKHRRQCTTRRRVLGSVSGFQGIIFSLCIRHRGLAGRRTILVLLYENILSYTRDALCYTVKSKTRPSVVSRARHPHSFTIHICCALSSLFSRSLVRH